jgi:hypothetical protein
VSGGTLNVQDKGELNVQGNGTLEVSGGTLTVNGELNIEDTGKLNVESGTLTVDGTLEMAGTAGITVDGGTFNIGVNADGDRVNGDITIKDSATLAFADAKQHFTGAGYTIFNAGGTMTQELVGGTVSIVGGIDSGAVLELESGEFKANATEFILNGNATLKGDNGAYLLDAQTMKIENGALTIADNVEFIVSNTTLTIGQGGTLVGAGANAKITLDATATVTGAGATNFYKDGTNTALTPVTPGKTYKWDSTDAGGNQGTVGWEHP